MNLSVLMKRKNIKETQVVVIIIFIHMLKMMEYPSMFFAGGKEHKALQYITIQNSHLLD